MIKYEPKTIPLKCIDIVHSVIWNANCYLLIGFAQVAPEN